MLTHKSGAVKMSSLGFEKLYHIIWFLTAFTLINGQQVDLNGPSLGRRLYYCVNEELVFTCTGTGSGIQWTVPSLFSFEGFESTDPVPSITSIAGVDATIGFQQSSPMLVTNLTIQNVPNITVECFTDVVGSTDTLSLTSSSPPTQVQDVILELTILNFKDSQTLNLSVSINWTPINGSFDLKHYRVQLCSRVCKDIVNTTRSSAEMVVEVNVTGDTVYASVSTESVCDDIGDSSRSDSVVLAVATATVPVPVAIFYQDLTAIIILAVTCGVLVIVLLIVLGFCIKFCRDVKMNRLARSQPNPL